MSKFFKKATKQAAKLRLALVGPPGSGKTFTGLVVARDLGGKIAVIDTEKGSASKYADLFDFDVMEMTDSFHPKRYVEAIKDAEEAGYSVILIDSLSHAWIGEEGGLDLHDKAVARQKTKNSYTAWSDVTPHHNALVQALIQSKCHIIATMRTKVEYVQETDDRTRRTTIRKVGTSPIMRDGVEYEFDLVGDLDLDHKLVVTKSRCAQLSDKVFVKPDDKFTSPLIGWLRGDGRQPEPTSPPQTPPPPPPPAPPSSNGNGSAKKASRITEAILMDTAKKWEKAGYCSVDFFLEELDKWMSANGYHGPVEDWPEEKTDKLREFLGALLREVKIPASDEVLNKIQKLREKLGLDNEEGEERLISAGLVVPGTPGYDYRARKILAYLENLAATTKAAVQNAGPEPQEAYNEQIPF